jgi:DNA-binding transcriptional LysR family regulator
MASAANRLRITPSAISKRIALFEQEVGYKLIEPRGRKVELTPAAVRLVERLEPLLAEMKSLLNDGASDERGGSKAQLKIGVTDSVVASWGPSFLASVTKKVPGINLEIHAHRSPVIAERVLSGELVGGLCAGAESRLSGLRSISLKPEPMVLIPAHLKKMSINRQAEIEVISIETHALTWSGLRGKLRELQENGGPAIKVRSEVESFAAVVQLARAGFGNGLAPIGIASALGVPSQVLVPLKNVSREVSWIARASTLGRSSLSEFFRVLEEEGRQIAHASK